MNLPEAIRPRELLQHAGLFLLVALTCGAAMALKPLTDDLAGIWLANGLVVGLLLRMPSARWWSMGLCAYCGNLASNLLSGFPIDLGMSLALCNALEVVLAAALLRRRLGDDIDLRRGRDLAAFALFAVLLAPAASALLAATIVGQHSGAPLLAVMAVWYPADALGMMIVAPLLLCLRAGEQVRPSRMDILRQWFPASSILVASVVIAFAFAKLGHVPPLLFLTFPPLMYMVWRHGTPGAVVGAALLTLISLCALLLPVSPDGPMATLSAQVRSLILQGFLACATGMALAMATLLEQRQEYEWRMRNAARRLHAVADHMPAYVAQFDREQRFRFANGHYREKLGLEPESLIGRSVREVFGDPIYADFKDPIAIVLQGQPVAFERCAVELGADVHHRIELVPDRDEEGEVTGFYSLLMDITERKRAELRQAASEERLRMIADNLPVVIAYIDDRRVYRFCNRKHQAWFGAAPDEVIGRHMERVLPPAVIEAQRYYVDCAMHGARSEGSFMLTLGGQQRHVQASCVPDRGVDGHVRGIYMMLSDITEAKRAEQRLQQLARFDPLTGLANRRELHERLGAALNRISRYGGTLGVLFIDVDHFKGINDRLGHSGGDEVLQELALRLRGAVRSCDTVARVAGDEFVVVLEQLRSAEEPQFVARKLLATIGKPFLLDRGSLPVGVSIGIAIGRPGDVAEQLLIRADRALYAAKDGGRNTSRVAE